MNQQVPTSSPQPQVQNPTLAQAMPVQTPEMPPVGEPKESSGSLRKYILIALGAVLLVAASVGVTYWFLNREGTNGTDDGVVEEDTDVEDNKAEELVTHEDDNVEEDEEVSADPYEGWETYSLEMYDVSFRYPQGWNVIQQFGEPPVTNMEEIIVTNSEGEDVIVLVVRWPGRVGVGTDATGPLSPVGELEIEGATLYKYTCKDALDVLYEYSDFDGVPDYVEGCYRLSLDDLTNFPVTSLDQGWYTFIPGRTSDSTLGYVLLWYGNMDGQWFVDSRQERTSSSVQSASDLETIELVLKSISGLY